MLIWVIGGKKQIRISLIFALDNNEFGVRKILCLAYAIVRCERFDAVCLGFFHLACINIALRQF